MKTLFVLLVLCAAGLIMPKNGMAEKIHPNEATSATKAANARLLKLLNFADDRQLKDATRGFIAPLPNNGVIKNAQGRPVWDMTKYQFILDSEKAPDTVNPSLWRQSRLVMQGGLFKVTDRLYQVRNADLSNLTIIEGDTGIIVVDPLVSAETAKAALGLYYQHRPKKPVKAVVHSHSHVDHYGGVKGVVDEKDVQAGKIMIVAPEGFLEAAVSENVFAGTAMGRRASYMYGNLLPPSPTGQVGAGLGTTTSSGSTDLIPPTHYITKTGQKMNIDGLTFEFLLAPDSEAPSEMHWYIDELKAVTAAENCCHTLHNTYSLRGTKIRDPLAWSKYLNETMNMWGDKAEVMYGMHHWPVWGNEHVNKNLKLGRDAYRYINDETLRLANKGYVPDEIAEQIKFPEELEKHWSLRGYYGTISHNTKATYYRYLGWFDGNPAHLHPHPPVDASKKYVEYMGGADAIIKKARKAYSEGDYRWVAEVMNHVVFADPKNMDARKLEADALEQMGYQAESGPWRNFYLTGAQELRNGVNKVPVPKTDGHGAAEAMTPDLFFDYMSMRLNGPKASGKKYTFNIVLPDMKKKYLLEMENGVLNHSPDVQAKKPDATVTIPKIDLFAVVYKRTTLDKEIKDGKVTVLGNKAAFEDMLGMLDDFDFWFNIVTP